MAPELHGSPATPGTPVPGETGAAGARPVPGLAGVVPARFELPAVAGVEAEPASPAPADVSVARSVLLRMTPTQTELDFDPPCTLVHSIRTSYGRHSAPDSRRFHTHA